QTVRESLGNLDRTPAPPVVEVVPDQAAARYGQQPCLPLGQALPQGRQHRQRVVGPKPLRLVHALTLPADLLPSRVRRRIADRATPFRVRATPRHAFPRTASRAKQPRTWGPGLCRCISNAGSVTPPSSRASASTDRRPLSSVPSGRARCSYAARARLA